MKTTKQFKWFTIFEYEKEQEYLRRQHQNGWRFTKVTGFGMYHFEECTPEDVVYQLDYNEDAVKNRDNYLQMFADCGWEYLQDYAGYSYFRKPVAADGTVEEIFCDEESRLQMMQRVIKGRTVPLLVLFFCLVLPQFILNLLVYHHFVIAGIYGGILTIYLIVFLVYYKKYTQYKNATRS